MKRVHSVNPINCVGSSTNTDDDVCKTIGSIALVTTSVGCAIAAATTYTIPTFVALGISGGLYGAGHLMSDDKPSDTSNQEQPEAIPEVA